ncbi:MAG: hypothetical protein Q8O67_11315 [Deltaproteobacteria bacterium]|nr:hypothetical protein [Deltaproteobacteria bacterium]
MLTPTKPRKTLPILSNLDDIRIASPCQAEWDAMTPVDQGDGSRARFCGSCTKNVYDLSSMTRGDALALITRHEGNCCVRFYQRADGTVLTEDCPVGLKAAFRKAHRKAAASIAACAGAAAAVVAFLLGANPVSRKLEQVQTAVIVSSTPAEIDPPRVIKGDMAFQPIAEPVRPVVKPPKKPAVKRPPVREFMGGI